ncbi:contactin-5-like [Mercenaria mercenaria]|uniref:contactin-5-like n=1 Tax=Mercenaria mercenaria TaxID=6596 RepID=UPI00234E4248|nr:contactin-5-like [Mercenaria mercenaria]
MYRVFFFLTHLLIFTGECVAEGNTQTATEGSNLTVFCDGDTPQKGPVYWENRPLQFHQDGATLSIHHIQRNFTGQYDCFEVDTSTNKSRKVFGVFVDVTYPAKILSANVFKSRLIEEETFATEVLVEGNPSPEIKFTQLTDGDVVYEDNKDGKFNISFVVHCRNIGRYLLTCSNDLNYDTMHINITVICKPKPDPDHLTNTTFKPRLGDSVALKMTAIGYPPPNFQWWHNGVQRDSADTNLSSVLTINPVAVLDFGTYTLNVSNEGGYFVKVFEILAYGPPSPVTHLSLTTVSTTNASLSFLTGFDYNDTQTFVAMRYQNGIMTELNSVNDDFPDDGQKTYSFTVEGLTALTKYNITVVSRNSRGMSSPAQNYITFLTEGAPKSDPDKTIIYKYKPRVGENVQLEMFSIGNPAPYYTWEHAGKQVQHVDNSSYSAVNLHAIEPESYGAYIVTMSNSVGTSVYNYFIEADGPPSPVTCLSLTAVSTTSASLSFISGFDYNDTQIFVAMRYQDGKMTELYSVKDTFPDQGQKSINVIIKGLNVLTMYNLTVVSRNSRGSSPPALNAVTFLTKGTPASDPDKTIIYNYKPRVGENVKLEMFAIGNPVPTYTWQHGGKDVQHTDTAYYSAVDLGIGPESFGTYTILMSNSVGKNTYNYLIEADGPPDAASGLYVGDVSTTAASLSWIPGFDYGSTQTFIVVDPYQELDSFVSEDHTLDRVTRTIYQLQSDTTYVVQIKSRNNNGEAASLSNAVQFHTKVPVTPSPPKPTPAPSGANTVAEACYPCVLTLVGMEYLLHSIYSTV